MRFNIRDLLWATVVVGLALGWRLNASTLRAEKVAAEKETARNRKLLIAENQAHLELSGNYLYLRTERDRNHKEIKSLHEELQREQAERARDRSPSPIIRFEIKGASPSPPDKIRP
jgi:hypothetical protein